MDEPDHGRGDEGPVERATYMPPSEPCGGASLGLAAMNSSAELMTLRSSGVLANESGLTGPMVMNEYSRLSILKEECGSRKRR
jgi:hypothetical protein